MKYTDYELSKQLHELGFESKSHCGWWGRAANSIAILEYCVLHELETEEVYNKYVYHDGFADFQQGYKAYDCYDLLMWLQKVDNIESKPYSFYIGMSTFWMTKGEYDTNPANALAKAIIQILKEKQ